MTATATADGRRKRTCDFGFVRGDGLDGAEDAFARGIARALGIAGFRVADLSATAAGLEPGATVVAATLADAEALLARVDGNGVLVPIVRGRDELPRWVELAARARTVWTGSPRLAADLQAGGGSAHHVGVACQLGAVRHHARAAHGVRDEDFVFGVHPTAAAGVAELDAVRAAVRAFYSAPATRYAKASVLVSAARDGDLRPWRELAEELRCDAIVSAHRPGDGPSFAGFAALADCEIVVGAGPGLVPWAAAAALFLGRTTLVLGDLEPDVFGDPAPPHLRRLPAVADELAYAMTGLVEHQAAARRTARAGSRQLLATSSARAVAVAIAEALRADGLWRELPEEDA